MQIRNLTPHAIHILNKGGDVIWTAPSEGVARAAMDITPAGDVDGVPTAYATYGEPVGLPAPDQTVRLIVSSITVAAAREHGRPTWDLLTPGELVRDADGVPVGCRNLFRQ